MTFWDEFHRKQSVRSILSNRKKQYRFSRNDEGYVHLFNGQIKQEAIKLNIKYAEESRFSFGCAMVEIDGGAIAGRRCHSFVYTGKWPQNIHDWQALIEKEQLPGDGAPG